MVLQKQFRKFNGLWQPLAVSQQAAQETRRRLDWIRSPTTGNNFRHISFLLVGRGKVSSGEMFKTR